MPRAHARTFTPINWFVFCRSVCHCLTILNRSVAIISYTCFAKPIDCETVVAGMQST